MGLVKNLREHVAQSCHERKLFRRGERILVAVSGGVDSMVLLHLLHELAATNGWKISVAHFNHQLRGRASDADERLVRQTAAKCELPFYAGRGNVKAVAKERGISIEMAARELRHNFLAETARRSKCSVLATAHHADDQVELFFLRFLRGAGGSGLGGMKWNSVSPVRRNLRLVRPLLAMSKLELLAFARAEKISFREDATNASRDLLRNRVRHELLPLLRKNFQPALNRTVLRLMEVLGKEAEAVSDEAKAWLAKFPHDGDWSELPVAVQRRIICEKLQRLKVTADFELVEALRRQPGVAVTIAPGRALVCGSDGQVAWMRSGSREFNLTRRKLNLTKPGTVSFGELQLAWGYVLAENQVVVPAPNCEFFDAAKVGRTVILRHWQPGDRFQPIGMKATVKLQDWFTNQKVPAARRRELTLATTARGEIFWVEGMRIGDRVKITNDTRQVLQWRWSVRPGPKSCIAGDSAPC
jgi:tRNA(Ile)-lysidine synthase